MAEVPNSGAMQLLALGMFIFAIDNAAYSELVRRTTWRHSVSERFMARPKGQYVGPGDDVITLNGRIVPELGGQYSAIEILRAMADTGDDWPLVNGLGKVLGHFRIVQIEEHHVAIMAGGLPKVMDFAVDLERVD